MIVSSICSFCMSHELKVFTHCLSSTFIILSTDFIDSDMLVYARLLVLEHSGSMPSSLCADELKRPSELVPCGVALCYSDAKESTLGFKSSSQGPYTALILLCMYPCKALYMPVMWSTATADSSWEPKYRRDKMYLMAELKTFSWLKYTVFISQQDSYAKHSLIWAVSCIEVGLLTSLFYNKETMSELMKTKSLSHIRHPLNQL